MRHESRIELRDKSYELRLRPQSAYSSSRKRRQLVMAMRKLLAHGVVGFDNFRQATRLV